MSAYYPGLELSRDVTELLDAITDLPKSRLESASDALATLLEHEDPDVRELVLTRLFVEGKDRMHRDLPRSMLFQDPETTVKSAACYAVAATSSEGEKASDTKMLVRVLQDETADTELRRAAYEAILILHRRQTFPSVKGPFDPQRHVDWPWVSSLFEITA